MRLYIVNGKAGAGKDTFCHMVKDIIERSNYTSGTPSTTCRVLHSSDRAKTALRLLGWGGEKTPEIRLLLAELVDFWQEREGFFGLVQPFSQSDVVFYHERDPKRINEIVKEFHKFYPMGTVRTVLVNRLSPELEPDHWGIDTYSYDRHVNNVGDLDHLRLIAETFIVEENL